MNKTLDKETKRKKAREFLRVFARRDDWFVLDTETTGPDREEDEVIEVSILDATGKEVFDTLVRPTCEISDGAKEVHGIGSEDVKGAPGIDPLRPTLTGILRSEIVLIYNRDFDRALLENSFRARGFEPESNRWDLRCVMKAYAMAEGEWDDDYGSYSWVSLEEAAEEREVSFEGVTLHRARGDAELTRRLVRSFRKEAAPEVA